MCIKHSSTTHQDYITGEVRGGGEVVQAGRQVEAVVRLVVIICIGGSGRDQTSSGELV